MKLEPFAMERLQSIWENRVAWNLSESGVHPLRVEELAVTDGERHALLAQELGYPQTNGTSELREAIASMYPGATTDHIEVTNGGSEANCIALWHLVEPGDEVVMMMPNYMQVRGLARGAGRDGPAVAAGATATAARAMAPGSRRARARWSRRRHARS